MKYYTVDEIAEMLKLNRFTVYRWISKKQIKFTKFGASVRVSEVDLQDFINKCKSE
jgi:excisionase family DNA binding protein